MIKFFFLLTTTNTLSNKQISGENMENHQLSLGEEEILNLILNHGIRLFTAL